MSVATTTDAPQTPDSVRPSGIAASTANNDAKAVARCRRMAARCGLVVAGMGVLALLCFLGQGATLWSVALASYFTPAPTTSLGFLLLGSALFVLVHYPCASLP